MNSAPILLTLLVYAGLVCVGAILEALGVPPALVMLVAAAPVGIGMVLLALSGATMDERAWLAGVSSRSAFAGGAWLALHALACVLLAIMAGGIAGAPGLFLPLAAMAGIMVSAAIIAPAIRASGAATLPGFLALRFGNRSVRVLGALFVVAICLPLAALLMQACIAGMAGLFDAPFWTPAFVVIAVMLIAVPGGVNSLSAGHRIISLLLLFACAAPAAWLLATQEAASAWRVSDWLDANGLWRWHADAPGVTSLFCVALAVAAFPALLAGFAAPAPALPRLAGWGVAFIIILLAAAAATGIVPESVSGLFTDAMAAPGFRSLPLAVRVLAGVAGLMAAGFVLASLLLSVANALSHDIYYRSLDPMAPTSRRLVISRLLLMLLAGGAAYGATGWPDEIAAASLWSLSLAAGGLFPVLVLGIWWRGATAPGAAAGLLAAAVMTTICLVATSRGFDLDPGSGDEWTLWFGLDPIAVAALSLPVAVAAMVGVSLLRRRQAQATTAPYRHPEPR